MKITDLSVIDWRYPTSLNSDGSDAVHKDPDYSCVYVVLHTDDEAGLEGYGLTFTLGRGNEVVAACCESLAFLVVGKDFEKDILSDLVGFSRTLTQDGQLRWIGPEKGVLSMACGAVLNAVWDLWCRIKRMPLWEMVAEMEPEDLVELIDFKHLSDEITKPEGLALLKAARPGWQARVFEMKRDGYPAYTTSAGWLGYPEAKIRALCQTLLAQGHRYFKMKVGSADPEEDIMRARAIREVIGEGNVLMMDANQKWDVPEAIANMRRLAEFRPLWIEEPTNCDDIVGHRQIAKALRPLGVGVATGEVAQNKVIFKQLLQEEAIEFCQIDSCRIAGPSEIFSVLLMAAKRKVKVCPHAGGVGLCEYVRHLSMIDYVCFSASLDGRVCESTTHLHEFFEDPVDFRSMGDGAIRYVAPKAIGFAKFLPSAIDDWTFPKGHKWSDPSACGDALYAKAKAAMAKDGERAAAVTESTLAMLDPALVRGLQAKCAAVLAAKPPTNQAGLPAAIPSAPPPTRPDKTLTEAWERNERDVFSTRSRQGYFGDTAAVVESNASGDPRIVLAQGYGQPTAGASLAALSMSAADVAAQLEGCAGRYAGKTVIVTGGARGIGEGCVRVFFEAGSNVVLCDCNAETGGALCEELNALGRQVGRANVALFVQVDVSVISEVEGLVTKTIKAFGRVDCISEICLLHPLQRV